MLINEFKFLVLVFKIQRFRFHCWSSNEAVSRENVPSSFQLDARRQSVFGQIDPFVGQSWKNLYHVFFPRQSSHKNEIESMDFRNDFYRLLFSLTSTNGNKFDIEPRGVISR